MALIHSELSEALEEYRNGREPTEIYYTDSVCTENGRLCVPDAEDECGAYRRGKPEGIPIELADVIIRISEHAEPGLSPGRKDDYNVQPKSYDLGISRAR